MKERRPHTVQEGKSASHDLNRPAIAPGKVTRTSLLPASPSTAAQHKSVDSGRSAASKFRQVKSAWAWTSDPLIDAALRGTPVPTSAVVQRQGADTSTSVTPPLSAGEFGGTELTAEAAPEIYGLCNRYGDWTIYPDDFIGALPPSAAGAFHVRQSEFQSVTAALDSFHSARYKQPNFHPSTGPGVFDVDFTPHPEGVGGQLTISLRVAFNFVSALTPTDYPGAAAAELAWQKGEQAQYTTACLAAITGAWSGAMQFQCTRQYWDNVRADVTVRVYESTDSPHYTVTVQKIPPGEFAGSSARAARKGSNHGTATFDSEDINPVAKPGGQQRAAVHEFGHLIGLGDEYAGRPTPRHAAAFQSVTGQTIATGADDRVMSGGERILAEHYITFLQGLKAATAMEEWGYA